MHATIHKKERKVKLVLRQFLFFSPLEYTCPKYTVYLSEAPFSIMIMIKHNKKKEIHTHVLHPKQSKTNA